MRGGKFRPSLVGEDMKRETPYILYTADSNLDIVARLDVIQRSLDDVESRLDAIEKAGWVSTDRISDNAVTGAKIAPFKDW